MRSLRCEQLSSRPFLGGSEPRAYEVIVQAGQSFDRQQPLYYVSDWRSLSTLLIYTYERQRVWQYLVDLANEIAGFILGAMSHALSVPVHKS